MKKNWSKSIKMEPTKNEHELNEINIIPTKNMDHESNNGNSSKRTYWNLFGQKFPKTEILFFAQTILIYIVVSISLYNLTRTDVNKSDEKLWVALLSSSIGYLLPNPSFK